MSRGIVISLADRTGYMVKPWVDNGYSAVLVDPQHDGITVDGPIVRVGYVIDHPETWKVLRDAIATGRVVFVSGFPPCTNLATSGAHAFPKKLMADHTMWVRAIDVVHQCKVIGELSGAPWVLENPKSKITSLWRKPDHTFHPFHYTAYFREDNYTKLTCLWSGGGFVMPPKNRRAGLGTPCKNRIIGLGPKTKKEGGRSNARSVTPRGFAYAVYLANAPHLRTSP